MIIIENRTCSLWDITSSSQLSESIPLADWEEAAARFRPDGQRVVIMPGDRRGQLWDTVNGKAIGESMELSPFYNEADSAGFSPDSQRLVTTSWAQTAQLWEAKSGRQIGEPLNLGDLANSLYFSADGQRVIIRLENGTVRLWDVRTISSTDNAEDLLFLANSADATGGISVPDPGSSEILKAMTPAEVLTIREKIAARFVIPSIPLQQFLKWSVWERRNRAISPCSKITVAEWIENSIKEGSLDNLRSAIRADPANALVAAHFGKALADHALGTRIDQNESRRARAEADFQTRRGLKLAPDSAEVQQLRAEVVRLSQLPK